MANCPHRFKLQYIDKSIEDEGSLAARRGSVVHETFEEITKAWLIEKPLDWEQVRKILTQKMTHYLVTDDSAQKVCIGAAKKYMENPPLNLDTVLGTEEQIAVKWQDDKWVTCAWDDPDAYARGKIDLLMIDDDNIATIIDHKTQMFVETADTFQMGFYAWLVKQAYPYIESVRTILHFCHPDINFYSKSVHWTQEDIDDNIELIKTKIDIAENMTEYPAEANHHCKYCPIKLACPRIQRLRRKRLPRGAIKGPILSAQEAKKQAEVLTVLEENSKEVKSSLKTFVEDIGAVQLPGLEYALVTSDSYVVPLENKKELIEKLGEYGQNPYSFFEFSATKLKKLWRTLDQKQIEEISNLIEPKKSTSFRSRKI